MKKWILLILAIILFGIFSIIRSCQRSSREIVNVYTDKEIENAKRIRTTEGKHVIPVPTFELKKDFSGYLLDPLQIFK